MAIAISLLCGLVRVQISGKNKADFDSKYLIFRREGKKKSGKVFLQSCFFTSYFEKRAITSFAHMEKTVYIKEVNKFIQLAGNGFPEEFSIEYRKKNGAYGVKKRCRRRAYIPYNWEQKKDLSSVERENKIAGTYKLEYYEDGKWKEFDVLIPLMVKFNDKIIDHRF